MSNRWRFAWAWTIGATLLTLPGCGSHRPPTPIPTPTPTPTPTPLAPLLLRQPSPHFLTRAGQPHKPQGAIQCCMTPETVPAGIEVAPAVGTKHQIKRPRPMPFRPGRTEALCNSLWPMAAECFQDYMTAAGFNFFHFRMGPFYASPDLGEDDFAEIGGPYLVPPDWDHVSRLEWNPPFWETFVRLLRHARKNGSNIEINDVDLWLCKHAQWGDLQMPWPQEDIDACGRRPSPEQERFIRKVVSEAAIADCTHCIYITDNEGGEIQGTKREWYEWNKSIILDEAAKRGLPVPMVGTNNTDFCDGSFDYCATHDTAALLAPIAGKHTENNEHNKRPGFTPEQEHANHCAAQTKGLHWWFWRAEMSDADFERTRALFAQGCGGPVECFPPESEDPQWEPVPVEGGSPELRWPIDSAKLTVGERCGSIPPHEGGLATLDLLGAEMRKRGYCAASGADALSVRDSSGRWQEYHSVRFVDGCWAQDLSDTPKATYTYNGPPRPQTCPVEVPVVDEILCKLHQATNAIYDCTPKTHGQPTFPAGDPMRQVCELKAMGGASPTFSVDGGLAVSPQPNPMQFKLSGSGSGVVTCTVPAVPGRLCNLAVSR